MALVPTCVSLLESVACHRNYLDLLNQPSIQIISACVLLICAGIDDLESTERPQVDVRLNAPPPRADARLGNPSWQPL